LLLQNVVEVGNLLNLGRKDKPMSRKETQPTAPKDAGFWREIWQQARLVYYLLRDPQVPFYLKLIPFAAVLYLLWPIDLLADVVPVLGQLDDLTALIVTSKVFVELAPQQIVAQHLNKIRQMDGFGAMMSGDGDDAAASAVADAIVIDGEVIKKDS
jgi:uncharacterized membrane protein YkvA (DUF1232 family)